MALYDPEQLQPELIEFDEIINNENYPPYPISVVSQWRIGSQLRHAMETESAYIGHKQGALEFIRLLNEFELKDMENVIVRDIDIILEIVCTFDRADLLKLLIQHIYLSDFLKKEKDKIYTKSLDDDNKGNFKNKKTFKPLQSALKKSIRTGQINVLNYLITQNIIPINLFDDNIQSKQFEHDLKSLLYNILRAIEIGSKKKSETKSNCFLCAQQFWPYLAMKVNHLKQSMFINKNIRKISDNKALKKLINSEKNKNEKEEKDNELISNLKAMNEDYLIIKYMSQFMKTMFSNKQISNEQIMAIFDVLIFQRERHITFNDRTDVINSWKLLYKQLVRNYLCFADTADCFELDMIDYLISGGVQIDEIDRNEINNNGNLQTAVENGENNWNIKNWNQQTVKLIMPDILPIDINKLIICILCL